MRTEKWLVTGNLSCLVRTLCKAYVSLVGEDSAGRAERAGVAEIGNDSKGVNMNQAASQWIYTALLKAWHK